MARSNTAQNVPISVDDISPGFSADYTRYLELNPTSQQRPQTIREANDLFFSDSKQEHTRTNAAVARRIRTLHIRIRSKIEQMECSQLWQTRGPATSEEFKRSPRTFGKTIEDINTDVRERIALTREEGNNSEFLRQLILDPALINDTRLRNLGLEEFIAPKGSGMETRMQLRAQAVDALREMLIALEPIRRPDEKEDENLRYFRLMRVGKPDDQSGERPSTLGYIVGTQHVYVGKKGGGERRKTLFKTDLYGAGLRLKEIDESYENEIAVLKMIEELLTSIVADLEGWKSKTLEERDRIAEKMGECIDELENVDDEDKIKLREMVQRAVSLRDHKGRFNPQTKVSQIERAKDYLGSRFKTIEETWAYLGKDKAKVEQIRQTNIQPLAAFMKEVTTLHTKFALLQPSKALDPEHKETIITNLKARRAEAEKMTFEPLLAFAEVFIANVDATISALEAGDQVTAAKEFMKMFVITKVVRSMDRLKQTYERIALSPETINPDDLQKELDRQLKQLKNKEAGTEIATQEYNKIFGELYHLYSSLLKRIKELKGEVEIAHPEGPPAKTSQTSESRKPKMTVASIIASLKQELPHMSAFFGRLQEKVSQFMRPKEPIQPVSRSPETNYTPEQKLESYAKMQARIKAFDYVDLVHRHLPQAQAAVAA